MEEEDLDYGRISQQQWSENSSTNGDDQRGHCNRFCRLIKSRCSLCCAFGYENISQLTAAVCFGFIFVVGILKVVFGSVSLSYGQIAIILAKQDNLHWSGVFLLVVGLSSMICGVAAFHSILYKRWSTLTAKQLYAVIFGMLYIVLFDAIAVIMVSKYTDEHFSSNIEINLQTSLKDRYGVSSTDYQEHWDQLQIASKCCGATSFREWLQSAWADEINATSPSSVNPLPLSCHYENLPHGACVAIAAVPQQAPVLYLLLDEYERTNFCDKFAQFQGRLDYIYADSCSKIYALQLSEEMRATMIIAIIFTVTDFVIILALASVACKLPFRRRVHVYDIQQT